MCFPPSSAASAGSLHTSIRDIVAQSSQHASAGGCAGRQSYVARSRSGAVPTVPIRRPQPNCLRLRAADNRESDECPHVRSCGSCSSTLTTDGRCVHRRRRSSSLRRRRLVQQYTPSATSNRPPRVALLRLGCKEGHLLGFGLQGLVTKEPHLVEVGKQEVLARKQDCLSAREQDS
jgi:hypothetical protein